MIFHGIFLFGAARNRMASVVDRKMNHPISILIVFSFYSCQFPDIFVCSPYTLVLSCDAVWELVSIYASTCIDRKNWIKISISIFRKCGRRWLSWSFSEPIIILSLWIVYLSRIYGDFYRLSQFQLNDNQNVFLLQLLMLIRSRVQGVIFHHSFPYIFVLLLLL